MTSPQGQDRGQFTHTDIGPGCRIQGQGQEQESWPILKDF